MVHDAQFTVHDSQRERGGRVERREGWSEREKEREIEREREREREGGRVGNIDR